MKAIQPEGPLLLPAAPKQKALTGESHLKDFWQPNVPTQQEFSLVDRFVEWIGDWINWITELFFSFFSSMLPKPTGRAVPQQWICPIFRADGVTDDAVCERRVLELSTLNNAFGEENVNFNALVADFYQDSVLGDEDVNLVLQAFWQAHHEQKGFAVFYRRLTGSLKKYRYNYLLRQLHVARNVQMTRQDNPGDGNCFLHSCINALRRLSPDDALGRTQKTLRIELIATLTDVLGNPVDTLIREHFLVYFLAGEAGLGQVIPRFARWEEHMIASHCYEVLSWTNDFLAKSIDELTLQAVLNGDTETAACRLQEKLRATQRSRLEKWEDFIVRNTEEDILTMSRADLAQRIGQTTMGQVLGKQHLHLAAKNLCKKLEIRNAYMLEQWEQEVFVQYGTTPLLGDVGPAIIQTEITARGVQGDVAELTMQFRSRLTNILKRYEAAAARNRNWNGHFETLLAARALKRCIVTLEYQQGRWQPRSIVGEEFLPLDMARLHEHPPLTIGHTCRHYITLFYPEVP